jgi:hypothetical protein
MISFKPSLFKWYGPVAPLRRNIDVSSTAKSRIEDAGPYIAALLTKDPG